MIETRRLILRRWREADRGPYAAMMADPAVAGWLGGVISRAEADRQIDRVEAGFERLGIGGFAVERRSDGALLGSCGLGPINLGAPAPQGVEVGWRLMRAAWGCGYATEAATAALRDGFERLALAEILAFTARTNLRSQAVMARLGLTRDPTLDFDHPGLAASDPLCRHLVYRARLERHASF